MRYLPMSIINYHIRTALTLDSPPLLALLRQDCKYKDRKLQQLMWGQCVPPNPAAL